MSNRLASAVTAGLTCIAAAGSFASLRFARSVFVDLVERSGANLVDQSRLTVVALGATSPAVLMTVLLGALAASAVAETVVKAPHQRLLIHIVILLAWVLLLAVAVSGFLIAFHIPDVRIP